jgi:pimeloyl-ACP methyl ester carboxylesterase
MAMAQLLAGQERFAGDIRAIWLTPAFRMPGLAPLMARSVVPSLIVIGDADPHYDVAALESLPATMKANLLVIPGADHGLDRPGDVNASILALGQTVAAMERFVGSVDQTRIE